MCFLCDALTTPELCPVWCGATSRSFSNTATVILGYLLSNSLAVARPTIPPPTVCRHQSVSIRLKHKAMFERVCYYQQQHQNDRVRQYLARASF